MHSRTKLHVVGALALCLVLGACDRVATRSQIDFTLVPNTDDVSPGGVMISLSPDGRYLVMQVEVKAGGKWRYGLRSVDLATGTAVDHMLGGDVSPALRMREEKREYATDYGMAFRDDGWRDGLFFLGTPWPLVVDPRSPEMREYSNETGRDYRSSDRLPRSVEMRFERRLMEIDAKSYGGAYVAEHGVGSYREYYSVPVDTQVCGAVFYAINGNDRDRVDRFSPSGVDCVFRNPGEFLTRKDLSLVRVSPNNRFLAVVWPMRRNLMIPAPIGDCVLFLVDLGAEGNWKAWEAGYFGSCAWSPNGDTLYIVSYLEEHSDAISVYKIDVESVFGG